MCGTQWNDIISNIVFIRTLFSNKMISFLTLQCELFVVAMSQIMLVLCPHGTGDGGGKPNVDRLGQGEVGQKF